MSFPASLSRQKRKKRLTHNSKALSTDCSGHRSEKAIYQMRRVCYCNITYKCNNRCRCCISHNVRKGSNRSLGLDDYSFFQRKFSLGANDVWTISGGEPTLHPSFNDIVSFCHDYSSHIVVYSNGRTLSMIPEETLGKIERIIVPIYGDEATHNDYVRSSNAYRETIDSVKKILNYSKNILDIKLLFIDPEKGMSFLKSSEWNDVIVNNHFSVSRVIDNEQQENFQDICRAASDVIDSLLDLNKVVRFYDLPLCELNPDTLSRILKSVDLTNVFDPNVICGSTEQRYMLFPFNKQADYFPKCETCQNRSICARIMQNYFAPVIVNGAVHIDTE